jgi:dTDP-4-dehydrorhamnose 3,5-epimerase-like enzyme
MEEVKIINLPKIEDPRGNLTFIEQNKELPFTIKRVYWIYDVPGGQLRGGHAFKEQCELIVALSGSLDVVIHNGSEEKRFHLNRSYFGLYVPNGLWRQMDNFSTNSVALVLSSTAYSEADYIREFEEFKSYKQNAK